MERCALLDPYAIREGVSTPWFQVTVEAPLSCAESVANFLIDSGAPGLEIREEGASAALIAHFSDTPPLAAIESYCAAIGLSLGGDLRIDVRPIDDQDWAHAWRQHVRPQIVGKRLYICPTWETDRPADRTTLIIDPGMAFGTGQHPSTRGCLTLLERTLGQRSVRRALDVGTGSGVLSIALAKLGVTDVWAVDIDPVACAVAAENARINSIQGQIHLAHAFVDAPPPFDLIVANLYADLLEDLAPRLATALLSKGSLICSGFVAHDEARVMRAYESYAVLRERHAEDDWVTLSWVVT